MNLMPSLVNFRPVSFLLLTPALWIDPLIFFPICSLNPFFSRKITSCFLSGPPMSLILSFDNLYPQNIYLIIKSSWSCMMGKISSKVPLELLISETSVWGPLATFGPHPTPQVLEKMYTHWRWERPVTLCCVQPVGERMPWNAWFRVQGFHLNFVFGSVSDLWLSLEHLCNLFVLWHQTQCCAILSIPP